MSIRYRRVTYGAGFGMSEIRKLGRAARSRDSASVASPDWSDTAIGASRLVLWRWHADSGELEWGNGADTLRELIGNDFPPTLGELGRLMPAADADLLVRAFLEALNQRQNLSVRCRILRPESFTRWVVFAGEPYETEDGLTLVGSLFEEPAPVLPLQGGAFPPMVGAMMDDLRAGVCEINLLSGSVRMEPRLIQLLNLDPEAGATTEGWLKVVHPEDLGRMVEQLEDFLRSDRSYLSSQYRIVNRQQNCLWVEVNATVTQRDAAGVPTQLQALTRDITSQKLAEIAQYEVESRFRMLFEESPLGILYASITEPIVLDANPAFCRMSGYDRHQLQGMPVSQTWPTEAWNAERYQAVMDQAKRGEVDRTHWIRPLRCRDGSVLTIRMNGCVVLGHDGKPSYSIGMYEDITERQQAELAMRQSEERFRSLIEETEDLIFVTDPLLTIGYASPAAERLFGPLSPRVDPETGVSRGINITQSVIPEHVDRALIAVKEATAHGEGTASLSLQALDASGRLRDFDVQIRNALGRDGIRGIVFAVSDVTDQRRAELATHRQLLRLRAMHMIDMAINAGIDIRMTLGVVLDTLVSHLTVDAAVIRVMASPGFDLEEYGHRGILEAPPKRIIRVGEGLAGRAVFERRRLSHGMSRLIEVAPTGESRTVENYLQVAVPLIAKGQVQGVLQLWTRADTPLGEADEEFVDTLAGQTAIAIDNAQLFESLQRSNEEVLLAYDATIEGWSQALDLRDKETEGHTLRVTEMTLRLARAMGIDNQELLQMRRGCLLHDIGKMGVPDRILLKPGALDADEWELMRMHPVYAYEWLSAIPFLRPALTIPHAHHEKWDGTGYPLRLKGDEIPLAARIFAVIDVFDALSSDRPYRPAMPAEQVMAYIQQNIGTHFDPRVVAAFLALWREDPHFRSSRV